MSATCSLRTFAGSGRRRFRAGYGSGGYGLWRHRSKQKTHQQSSSGFTPIIPLLMDLIPQDRHQDFADGVIERVAELTGGGEE